MLKQVKVLIPKKRKSDECHTFIVNNDWIEMKHPTSHILDVCCGMFGGTYFLGILRLIFLFCIHKQALVAGIHSQIHQGHDHRF